MRSALTVGCASVLALGASAAEERAWTPDVVLEVRVFAPIVRWDEKLEYEVSLKNVSQKSLRVPDFVLGGRGFFFSHEIFDESGGRIPPNFVPEYFTTARARENTRIELQPGEERKEIDALDVRFVFPSRGRYRVLFEWEGFLSEEDEESYRCLSDEEWILVK